VNLSVLVRERARPARIRDWPDAWRLTVATVCLGAFMGQLDASIVTLTYRSLGTEFGASLAEVQWVSLSYLLTLATLLIPAGRLADAHGRKLLYLYGFVVFAAASAACGLAPSLGALIALRVLQGAGAALLQANSVALIATSAPAHRLRGALGIQAAAQAAGLALGPTVGGLVISSLGWRWIFLINIPIGALGVIAGLYLLPRTRQHTPTSGWDLSGLVLLGTATTACLLAISAASGLKLPGWAVILLSALAVTSMAAFLLRQHYATTPLLDLAVLRSRVVGAGLVGALGGYLVLFGPLVLIPVVLTSDGYTALRAGLVLTALPAGFALAATFGERLIPSGWSDRARCTVGALLAVIVLGALLAVRLTATSLIPLLGGLGIALGIFTPANNSLVMRAMPARRAGTGGGLLNMTRGLGTSLGVALVTLALHQSQAHLQLVNGPRVALAALITAAVLVLLSTRLSPATPAPRARGRGD
jgi:EmrB/QacA subfamily drug resistance transporter